MMKRWMMACCGLAALGLCHCGGDKDSPEPIPADQLLDPYRSEMSLQINSVLYGRGTPEEMLAQLAVLGVGPGKDFADFQDESGIDDWFEVETPDGGTRQVSLTCGLSPVVNDGKITAIFRSRKMIDGRMHEELRITPE